MPYANNFKSLLIHKMKNFPQHYKEMVALMQEMGGEIPETMQSFHKLHKAAIATGSLTTQTKELIALGIAIAVHCDGCIAFHVHDALDAGATKADILETIGVAIMMGGGPSLMYGCEAMEALKQFEEKKKLALV